MRGRILLPALTLLLVLGLAHAASAGGRGWGFWGAGAAMPFARDNWRNPADALQLTDEQIAKLQELEKATYDKTKALRSQLQDLMFELRLLRLQREPDNSSISSKMEQVNNLRKQLSEILQQGREQMKSVLTKEQLEKLTTRWAGGRHGWCRWRGAPGKIGPRRWV